MAGNQEEGPAERDKEQRDVRKLLNDVMSSYFSDQVPGSDLNAASREFTELLEEIQADLVSVHTADMRVDMEDHAEESAPEIEVSSGIITGPDEGSALSAEKSLFSDAFREIEFQSVEVAIPPDDLEPVKDQNDQIYSKIVSDALKAVPHQKVATVLGLFDGEPAGKQVPIPGKSASHDNRKTVGEASHISAASVRSSSLSASVGDTTLLPSYPGVSANAPSANNSFFAGEPSVEREQKAVFHKKGRSKVDIPVAAHERVMKVLPSCKIAFLYNRKHIEHDPSALSVSTLELPDRIIKAMWYLEKNHVFENSHCTLLDGIDMATEKDLLRVHEESYIRFVSTYASNGGGFLGDSTYITPRSYEIAKLSAGAAIKAGDLVAGGQYSFSFVMTRPPGHHAGRNRYGGFCLFNNAAILARYLQDVKKIEKVMILDWDAHAGDGTMDIFYDDPTVLTVSLHRDPHSFYPRRGFTEETGNAAGKGYSVNVEMPKGAGDEEYLFAFDEVVVPLIERFAPGFIICSCGFDGHHKEKNVGLNLSSEGFYGMASKLSSVYNSGIVLLMEGGYHDFNGQLCHSVLNALEGKPNPVREQIGVSSYRQDQQKGIFAETVIKVAEVKKAIPLLS